MMRSLLLGSLVDEKRGTSYAIVFGVWALVAIYAIAHDQYVVRIAPEHFTIYHRPIWGLEDAHAIAAAWAFKASLLPGVLLGFAALVVARQGSWPRVPLRWVFVGTAVVIILAELVCVATGLWVHVTGRGIYPEAWYPDPSRPMRVTQTIQITCYLASAAGSGDFLLAMMLWRWRAARSLPNECACGPLLRSE